MCLEVLMYQGMPLWNIQNLRIPLRLPANKYARSLQYLAQPASEQGALAVLKVCLCSKAVMYVS